MKHSKTFLIKHDFGIPKKNSFLPFHYKIVYQTHKIGFNVHIVDYISNF